jgi:hypothetical protein
MKKIPSWWREPNTRHPRGRYIEVRFLLVHRVNSHFREKVEALKNFEDEE